MSALKYWDVTSGTYKTLTGPPGPTNVSTDAGNLARLGSDSFPYVPATNVGRNKIHNPFIRILQRGTGNWTPSGGTGVLTADRWWAAASLDTDTISVATASDAIRTAIGDEECENVWTWTVNGNAGAGAFSLGYQRIEKLRRLAGKTVTLSFFYASSIANGKIGISYDQLFGTGGSPSANVTGNNVAVFNNVSGGWGRYSCTFTLPSVSGKTLGSNGDDSTSIDLWFSTGSSFAARSGIGVQTGTFQIWGMQLEIGSQMTPLERLDIALDLAECMRFYQAGGMQIAGYLAAAAQILVVLPPHQVPMRAIPVITPTFTTQSNCTGALTNAGSTKQMQLTATATAAGAVNAAGTYTASADL